MCRSLLNRVVPLTAMAVSLASVGCQDAVLPVPAASIELYGAAGELLVGDTIRLSASVHDAFGNELQGRPLIWSSSAPDVATVDQDGVVVGRAPGTAVIGVRSDGAQHEFPLLVEPVPVVLINPDRLLLVVGRTVRLVPTWSPESDLTDPTMVPVQLRDSRGEALVADVLTFAGDTEGVFEVSKAGELRATAVGDGVVIVRAKGVSATIRVRVVPPFSLTVLEGLPGSTWSRGFGINDAGAIVGTSGTVGPAYDSRLFIWRGGSYSEIPLPEHGPVSFVDWIPGLTNRGDFAGRAHFGLFTYIDGELKAAPHPGADVAYLTRPGPRGEVLVVTRWSQCNRNCYYGTFLVENGETRPHEIPGFGVVAMNESGTIAGTLTVEKTQRAALMADSAFVRILGGEPTAATGLTQDGRILGIDARPDSPRRSTLWVWDGIEKKYLAVLPDIRLVPQHANGRGEIIGNSFYLYIPPKLPVYWRDGFVARADDLTLQSEWIFVRAEGINEKGQIVGYGKSRSTGAERMLLLTPQQ